MPEIEEPTPVAAEAHELDSVRADNFIKVYANSAQIETSVWDFKIIFGEIAKVGSKLAIEQSVAVSMSPQHVKALLGVLGSNLREYEKRFGKINVPLTEAAAKEAPHKEVPHTHKEAPIKT